MFSFLLNVVAIALDFFYQKSLFFNLVFGTFVEQEGIFFNSNIYFQW